MTRSDGLAARLIEALEASEPDCRWTPDPGGIDICDEHSEIVYGAEGCEDSPRWWKAKAISVIGSFLDAQSAPDITTLRVFGRTVVEIKRALDFYDLSWPAPAWWWLGDAPFEWPAP